MKRFTTTFVFLLAFAAMALTGCTADSLTGPVEEDPVVQTSTDDDPARNSCDPNEDPNC